MKLQTIKIKLTKYESAALQVSLYEEVEKLNSSERKSMDDLIMLELLLEVAVQLGNQADKEKVTLKMSGAQALAYIKSYGEIRTDNPLLLATLSKVFHGIDSTRKNIVNNQYNT